MFKDRIGCYYVQVKLPESEVTNINSLHNYNLKREIQSILEALKIDASKELHNIKKVT